MYPALPLAAGRCRDQLGKAHPQITCRDSGQVDRLGDGGADGTPLSRLGSPELNLDAAGVPSGGSNQDVVPEAGPASQGSDDDHLPLEIDVRLARRGHERAVDTRPVLAPSRAV